MSGPEAIVAALVEFNAQCRGLVPWMSAADLAQRVGATGSHDAQFEANVQLLFDAGTIRLMAGGTAAGNNFYKAMLIPPREGSSTDRGDAI